MIVDSLLFAIVPRLRKRRIRDMGRGITYKEISQGSIGDNRNVVVSKCSAGGFTIAQQIVVDDEGGKFGTFLKGAIRIKDKEALQSFYDALGVAIEKLENEEADWDE